MKYFGIDLGTTNSVIAFTADQEETASVVVEIEQYDPLVASASSTTTLPSYVFYRNALHPDQSDHPNVIVGAYARNAYTLTPDFVAKSIKSQMGSPSVTGLSSTVPDHTPEAVSARILSHIKEYAQRSPQIRQTIDQAVIAVPANFSTAQKEATLKAAELAGFSVKTPEGKWIPNLLISEPNAVLYDIAQQYLDGKSKESPIDFSQPRKIIIFDIGGGTLDVTFEEVHPSRTGTGLKISEIASSRYTKLAGDDFDSAVAHHLFEKYLQRLQDESSALAEEFKNERLRSLALKRLTAEAEDIKIRLNNQLTRQKNASAEDSWSAWYGEEDEDNEILVHYAVTLSEGRFICGGQLKADDYLNIITPLLGNHLRFENYHNYSLNHPGRHTNIIAPILEVLDKADHYYRQADGEMKVDAVILNGGMAQLFWIKERLKSFFGIDPITTTDPALSVARGAAVFASHRKDIETVRYIQNDTLFLGLSAGAKLRLIEEQEELPCTKTIPGLRLLPNTDKLEIPILRKTDESHYEVIAKSLLRLGRTSQELSNLLLNVNIDQNGLLGFGLSINLANGRTDNLQSEMVVGDITSLSGNRILPPSNFILNPYNELCTLKNCLERGRTRGKKQNSPADVRIHLIYECSNPDAFEDPVLDNLARNRDQTPYKLYLYYIASRFCSTWSRNGKKRLLEYTKQDSPEAYRNMILQPITQKIWHTARRLSYFLEGGESDENE